MNRAGNLDTIGNIMNQSKFLDLGIVTNHNEILNRNFKDRSKDQGYTWAKPAKSRFLLQGFDWNNKSHAFFSHDFDFFTIKGKRDIYYSESAGYSRLINLYHDIQTTKKDYKFKNATIYCNPTNDLNTDNKTYNILMVKWVMDSPSFFQKGVQFKDGKLVIDSLNMEYSSKQFKLNI